ncbi:MAG TPA: biotin/lipoyl-containing protein [Solirubrobacterales bacterium]
MTPETIKALLDAFDRSDWREMVVTVGDDRLHVSRDPIEESRLAAANGAASAAPAPATGAPGGGAAGGTTPEEALATGRGGGSPAVTGPAGAPVGEPAVPMDATPTSVPDGHAIESPSVGLFWRAPSPGAPPFVEVGGQVKAGETVAIVEVMKLMNHVPSPVDGVVKAILVENGEAVEFGQPIVVVDPEG